jgi:hypothetical protein
MSLDLQIAVSTKVASDEITTFLHSKKLQVTNAMEPLDTVGSSYGLATMHGGEMEHLCTVYGPLHVEEEDLDDELAAMLLAPRWLYQINYSASLPERSVKRIEAVAKYIAKVGDGAVQDPQLGKIIWPRARPKRFVQKRDEPIGPMLELAFFLPACGSGSELMRAYIKCCRRFLPEALPTRYGTYEPMQHRLGEEGSDEPLLDFAEAESHVEYGGSFFWKSKRPFSDGSVFFGDRRIGSYQISYSQDPDRHRIRPMTLIIADVSAAPAQRSKQWADAICNFFVAVSRATCAFHASASISERVWRGPSWIGIPETPTWLSWYGGPYRDAVSGDGPDTVVYEEGAFVRRGEHPVELEHAGEHPVQPPPRLVGFYKTSRHRIADEIPDSFPRGDVEHARSHR